MLSARPRLKGLDPFYFMDVYRNYDATIKEWSVTLSPWHGLVYCLAVCKRSVPLYYQFADREGWGDKEAIILSHDLLALAIAGQPPTADRLEDCIGRLERGTPDTEDFDCTYATTAAIIHIHSTELMQGHKPENVYHVARSCYEIVDASVFEVVMPGVGIVTPEIERQVEGHKYLQDEIAWQRGIRDELGALREGDIRAAEVTVSTWSNMPLVH